MRTYVKLTLAALNATLMLTFALAGADAGAARISVTEREFEQLFEELTINSGGQSITCEVTLLGHYIERTIPKIANSQIGIIKHIEPTTEAEPPCVGGSITVLTETLPWKDTYQGFTGTLPDIAEIRQAFIGLSAQAKPRGSIACLVGTTARSPAFAELLINPTTGRIEGERLDETTGIPLGGGFVCTLGGEGRLSGVGHVLNLPGTSVISTYLI